MSGRIPEEQHENYETFRECLSEPVLKELGGMGDVNGKRKKKKERKVIKSKQKDAREEIKLRPGDLDYGKLSDAKETLSEVNKERQDRQNKRGSRITKDEEKGSEDQAEQSNDAEDLADFIDYLATLIFTSLPHDLRTLAPPPSIDPSTRKDQDQPESPYTLPLSPDTLDTLLALLPPDLPETLSTSGLLSTNSDLDPTPFISPILTAYIESTTTSSSPIHTRGTQKPPACELCDRTLIPLTFHHLIPRSTHAKVLKRGWHPAEALHQGAWVCRACHSFVHGIAGNEELAKKFYTLELIRDGGVEGDEGVREEVERWVKWVGGVRWKKR